MYILEFINENYEQNYEVTNVSYADTFMKRLFGLIGKSNFSAMIFKQEYSNRYRSSIHTCFMKATIDVLYVNHENIIQELVTLRPWKLYIPKNGYIKYIIELPENSIEKYNLKQGVKVVIKNEKEKTGQTKENCTDSYEQNQKKVK